MATIARARLDKYLKWADDIAAIGKDRPKSTFDADMAEAIKMRAADYACGDEVRALQAAIQHARDAREYALPMAA